MGKVGKVGKMGKVDKVGKKLIFFQSGVQIMPTKLLLAQPPLDFLRPLSRNDTGVAINQCSYR